MRIRRCKCCFFEPSGELSPRNYSKFRGDIVYLRSDSRQTIALKADVAQAKEVYLRSDSRQTIAKRKRGCDS